MIFIISVIFLEYNYHTIKEAEKYQIDTKYLKKIALYKQKKWDIAKYVNKKYNQTWIKHNLSLKFEKEYGYRENGKWVVYNYSDITITEIKVKFYGLASEKSIKREYLLRWREFHNGIHPNSIETFAEYSEKYELDRKFIEIVEINADVVPDSLSKIYYYIRDLTSQDSLINFFNSNKKLLYDSTDYNSDSYRFFNNEYDKEWSFASFFDYFARVFR